ncbi:MAG: TolC family protein, partial [Crocosphaera sp.]
VPIEVARLEEGVNIFALKSTLIDTITDTIETYLSLLQAQEQVKIQQLALNNAKRQLEIIQVLIDAGRRAPIELVQSKTDVANREVRVLEAQNRLAQARLDIIDILDIEQNLQFVATDIEDAVESINLEPDKLTQLAFANNPEYLQSLKQLQIAKFNVLLAENEKRWDLDLQVSYGLTTRNNRNDDQTDVRAGIRMSREFGNLSLEQSVERSQVNLERANNSLNEERESLKIELNNRIRDVKFNSQQIELAKNARELSEQQLENEQEKLRLGVRGVRLIDVLRFENDLVQAKNRELNAMIDYLNALTRLEQTLGITLDRWNIKINETS